MIVRNACVVFLALTACSSGPTQPERAPVSPAVEPAPVAAQAPSAPAPPAAHAPATPPPLTSAAAWTEPAAIEALAVDCAVAAPPGDYDVQPLACSLPFEQSCVWNPCFNKQMDCKSDCTKTCGSCEAGCTNTCSSCKSSCEAGAAGDACRRACASTTGSCRQACIARRDKCATAGCTAAAEVCEKDEKAKWTKNGCKGICPKVNACWAKCFDESKPRTEKEAKACADACERRFPKCDTMYCSLGAPGPGE